MPNIHIERLDESRKQFYLRYFGRMESASEEFEKAASVLLEITKAKKIGWDLYFDCINTHRQLLDSIKDEALKSNNIEKLKDKMFKYYKMIYGLKAILNMEIQKRKDKNRVCSLFFISSFFYPEPVIDNTTIRQRENYINEHIDNFWRIAEEVLNQSKDKEAKLKGKSSRGV